MEDGVEDGTNVVPMVSPGPRERLLNKREQSMISLRAKKLKMEEREKDERRGRIRYSHERCLRIFSKRYFGEKSVYNQLSNDEINALAEECASHSYRYLAGNFTVLAAEFYALCFYLIPHSLLWAFGFIPFAMHLIFISLFFDESETCDRLHIDYRFIFPFTYSRFKKIKPPVD